MISSNSRALRRCQLTTAILSTLLISGMAFAQDNTSNSGAQQGQEENKDESGNLDRIVVTGSRIKRSEVEGPSPVTVISTEQLQREGFVTVADTLRTITQNAGSSQNELNSAGGFTPNGSPINLRGLGEGRTLLLINGRRAADYPFPYNGQSNFQNFGNIPTAAVERIEILSGGASAIYGSDAVAGVVNVVLKKNYEGDIFTLRAGTSTTGGGDYTDLQWVGGKTGDNWSLTYALEYFYDEPVYAYQRDFMDSRDDNPLPPAVVGNQPASGLLILRSGVPVGSQNRITPPAGTCDRFGGEYVDWTYRAVYPATHPLAGQSYVTGSTCGYFKDVGYQTINNGNKDLSGYLYGNWQFDNGMELWSSLMAYHSKSELSGGLEFFGGPHTDGVGTRTAAFFATNPTINGNVTVQRIFTPQEVGGVEATNQKFTEKSWDFAIGLRGNFGEKFDWDLTLGRAEYSASRTRPRLDGSEVTNFFLGPNLGTAAAPRYLINLDRWYRPITPEEYRAMSSILKYEADSYVTQGNFVVSGDLFELPAGPLGIAGVIEYTKQGYELKSPAGILPTNRTVYNLTGTNGGGDRDRYAIGAEVSIPIFSMLKANLAGRFDKYNDITNVDDAKTWAAGLEFRPIESLLLRANYSTSFKAPDMHYVYNEGSGGFSTALDTFRCLSTGGTPGTASCAGATYSYSMFATSKGEPTLEEETGKSLTYGLVWDITDNLSVQADYYVVKLEGAVANLSSTFILDAEAGCRTGLTRTRQPYPFAAGSAFCQEVISRVTREPAAGEPTDRVTGIRSGPVNQSQRRVDGIDASIRYRMDTDRFGDFAFSLEWSHVLGYELQTFATDPIDRNWRDDPGNFDFRSRMRGSVGWQKGDWAANVFMTRYGSLPNWQETARVAPYFLWNANVSKKITDKASVSFFVNNIFNNFHPDDSGFNTYPFFWRGYSPIGRTVSAQFSYKFN
ncbi:TonB-dependent receptor plug domain-containing protein [Lysobacter brunescens]|uniref:TonB-dependent receptor plug domain-containing protein n=1 Tax=Lysobacter brunescens TaxID=262323 RepID=A0ABW2YK28_9GAMM